ncbi:MAG TPA: VaFE repeat-containing surface-anchored protein [Clostridiaceae bacterium]|nr:VaFE repeat-containing surface-anchored protein [Clostridiaceae bacterium]
MIETKAKKKNRLLMLILALIMVPGMIPAMSNSEVKAAPPPVSISHSIGTHTLSTSGEPRKILQMNLTDEAMSDLRQIYGAGALFLTDGGIYQPQTHDIHIDGQIAFCANPTVAAGTTYTDKVTISSTEVNSENYQQFFGSYSNYRYPLHYLKEKIINYYGNEQVIINHAAIAFLSGIIQQSNISNAITQELIDTWKTERPGEDIANVINVAELKATTNAFFFSWYYSFDAEIARATGGSVTTFASSDVINSFLNFYGFVYSKIADGTIKLLNPAVNIYYTPNTPSTVPVGSNVQVVHAISGSLKIEEKGSLKLLKVSSRPADTNNNSNYSLANAEYAIYSSRADANADRNRYKNNNGIEQLLITKTDGSSNIIRDLPADTYYVKEIKASKGFKLDPNVYEVEVKPGETAEVKSTEVPENTGLKLLKSSANTIATNGNNCYSLAGATYGVYVTRTDANSNTNSKGTLTTTANGSTNVIMNLPAGTYYVKEIKAPKGYILDNKVYEAILQPGKTTEVTVQDRPLDDPVSILLKKEAAHNNTPLALAEFTVKFYGGDYADNVDPETLGATPTRTWVLRTDGNGIANFRRGQENFTYDGQAYSYKVSGDDFYLTAQGYPTFPLGTVTIRETKAPQDYKINNEVFVRKIQPGVDPGSVITYNPPTIPNEPIPGKLQVVKESANKDMTDNNSKYSFTGIEYGLFKTKADAEARKNKIGMFTLKVNGTSNIIGDLIPATYYVTETKTSGGYVLDNTVHTVNVVGEHLITVNVMDTEDLAQSAPVNILIQKVDSETGQAIPQGDASLAGAEFEVNYYKGEHTLGTVPTAAPNATWIITTDETGKASMASARGSNLYKNSKGETVIPLGYLTIKEITAPEGYLINDKLISYKINSTGTGETISILQNLTEEQKKVEEEVIKAPFSLRKVMTTGEQSEVVDVEVDAVFVAIADKYVVKYGSMEEALKHTAEYAPSEWDRLVTDNNGNATSKPLAYGLYRVVQTEGKDETSLLKRPFTFEVKSTDQEIVEYTVNNVPARYPVRIVKKDAVTGENVILNSASFKIKDQTTGEYVKQKVGSRWYDTFMTTAEQQGEILPGTFYVPTEDDGTTVTPLKVKPGTYFIEEVGTPEGFVVLEEPKELIIGEDYVTHTDQDLDEIIEVVIENEPQYGELTLHKQGELFKEWTQRSVTLPVQAEGNTIGEEVEVPRANETLSLTRVYQEIAEPGEETVEESVAEEEIDSEATGTETESESETNPETEGTGEPLLPAGDGSEEETITEVTEIATDENGYFSEVVETGTYTVTDKDGNLVAELVVPDGETATLEFTLTETKMEGVYQEGEVTDQVFTYNQAVYEQGYLAGAEFELKAAEEIKSYDGQTVFYEKDDKLLFAQKDIKNGSGEVIYKKGEVITLPELTAEQMADKTLVDSKVVTEADQAIVLSRIPLGKYTLTEIKAPKGYILDREERSFEFTPREKTVLVDLKETPLIENVRQKLDVSLQKTLLSTPYFEETGFENIVIGMYTAEEILGLAQDSLVAVMAPDKDGKMTAKNIPQGNYYFKEISTKDGYILDETEYSITVEADENATDDKITVLKEPIVNQPATKNIKVVKVDKFTQKPLIGVEFNLFKLMADGSKLPIINLLTSDYIFITDQNGEILIEGLPHGTYSLEEIKAHDGYIKESESRAISVADDSKLAIKVENEPTRVSFNKIDGKTGEPVIGATLRLVNRDGNPLYLDENGYITTEDQGTLAEWLTDGTPFIVKGLSIDTLYTVIEVKAPAGYHKAEPVSFRVVEQTGLQLTEIPNTPYEPEIKTKAFNSDTNGKEVHAISKAKLCDLMTYVDLIEGREHKAVAKLVLKNNPEVVIAEAEIIFTPQEKDGEVTVCFGEIDLTKLAGEQLVVFEKVFDLTTGFEVASHEDINDEDQTITVVPVEIGTKASYDNGNKQNHALKELVVKDTVSYTGLIVGETYMVKGWLMDKSTGEALLIDGEKVTAETTFIAETTDGTVKMTFTFDGSELAGKDLVVFEELYYNSELIAEHKDINDKEQTITIEKPAAPAIPTKPVTNDNSVNFVVYLASGSIALLFAVAFMFITGKKKE